MSAKKKVRIGILSTAFIGTAKVIPAMQRGAMTEVCGLASRDESKARAVADELGIEKAYGSYDALLDDPDIDAIYNPLPNHLHVPWSIKSLEAGKHVLCEKPIGLSVDEARSLVDAGGLYPNLKVMEAFMYRHHPQWVKAKQLATDGSIGELKTIQSAFSYYNDDASNIRNMDGIGGGGLMDIGCYCISLSRFLFDAEPQRVVGLIENDPSFGVDRVALGLLDFGAHTSNFTCSTQMVPYQRVQIFGTTGRVEIEIPFNAPPDVPCKLWLQQGESIEEIAFRICDQYTIQGDLWARAILEDGPVPTPIEDALANMRVVEALFDSGAKGAWANV
ncbi:Gfo/Idh/MocA family oxidoreductase [Verrucomicrobiales bacterium]|nr:Gfo/Idh/MocA family oxidoreductase [Verrucomicrobiales bacterium]MDF1786303.1 Gfo/Idh/MocA family oxidoreductase [Verrucomicrobiales bacterium]